VTLPYQIISILSKEYSIEISIVLSHLFDVYRLKSGNINIIVMFVSVGLRVQLAMQLEVFRSEDG